MKGEDVTQVLSSEIYDSFFFTRNLGKLKEGLEEEGLVIIYSING